MRGRNAFRVGGFWLAVALLCAPGAQAQPPETSHFQYLQLSAASHRALERTIIDIDRLLRAELVPTMTVRASAPEQGHARTHARRARAQRRTGAYRDAQRVTSVVAIGVLGFFVGGAVGAGVGFAVEPENGALTGMGVGSLIGAAGGAVLGWTLVR